MISRFLVRFFIFLSGLQFLLGVFLFIVTFSTDHVNHAVFGMAIGLYLLWIILFGYITLKFKDSIRSFVLSIGISWKVKFVLFCTILALIEEAIATAMTHTAPWYGLQMGQAYITMTGNYWDLVLGHSVIMFVPLFIGWAWLLSRYDFSANQVFLIFGFAGTLVESIYAGPQHLLEIGMWMLVYGLMVYLPAYSLPARAVRSARWYHLPIAIIVPFFFIIMLIIFIPIIHSIRPSTLIVFPPMSSH